MRYSRLTGLGLLLGVLLLFAGCVRDDPSLPGFFTEDKAWRGDIPNDAEVVSPETFKKGIDSGEFVLVSSDSLAAQKEAQNKQFREDKTFLQAQGDLDPNAEMLLAESAGITEFEGDRPVTLPNGERVLLFGLGTQLRNTVETFELSQSTENALADYRLSHALLPDDLQAQLPGPESLEGKGLADVEAALAELNALLETEPSSLGAARLESASFAPQQSVNPGNGTDNDGTCTPTGLAGQFWFPLKNFVSPMKHQGWRRGTCWAFAAIGALESRERVQNNNPVDLSEQFLVNKVKADWDRSNFSEGYGAENALELARSKGQVLPNEAFWTYNPSMNRTIKNVGLPILELEPYANSCEESGYNGDCSDTAHQSQEVCTTFNFMSFCSFKTVTYLGPGVTPSGPFLFLNSTIQLWKNGESFELNRYRLLLSQGHVMMASFPVYKGFRNDVTNTGVVSNYNATQIDDKGNEVSGSYGGHAVQIVGFLSNSDLSLPGRPPVNIGGGGYFIIKNSWGCSAGDGGYYYVPADYVSRHFNKLSVLNFDTRRSDAWKSEQALPGSSEAPKISILRNPASMDLRIVSDLAQFFKVSHTLAKSVTLQVTSDKDGSLYNGPWSTDPNALFGSELKRSFATQGTRTLSLLASYGSRQTLASFNVNVVNTPPTLTLQGSGAAHQGEAYAISAQVSDINESDASTLCANTTWSVDAPDALSSLTGCQVTVTFGTTGSRQVRVSTRNSEGLSAAQTLNLNVLPPPENPFPKIVSYGIYARDLHPTLDVCVDSSVSSGSTIDLRETGCRDLSITPPPQRYSAKVAVENPGNEALSYTWRLHVMNSQGERVLYGLDASSEPVFSLSPYGNDLLVTDDCRISLTVNAPDPARSKSLTVWTGRCTYYVNRLN